MSKGLDNDDGSFERNIYLKLFSGEANSKHDFEEIHFSHFYLLQTQDSKLPASLRLVPSLSAAHIYQTNFQQMSVRLAVQVKNFVILFRN